jgi:hypothetical protein
VGGGAGDEDVGAIAESAKFSQQAGGEWHLRRTPVQRVSGGEGIYVPKEQNARALAASLFKCIREPLRAVREELVQDLNTVQDQHSYPALPGNLPGEPSLSTAGRAGEKEAARRFAGGGGGFRESPPGYIEKALQVDGQSWLITVVGKHKRHGGLAHRKPLRGPRSSCVTLRAFAGFLDRYCRPAHPR